MDSHLLGVRGARDLPHETPISSRILSFRGVQSAFIGIGAIIAAGFPTIFVLSVLLRAHRYRAAAAPVTAGLCGAINRSGGLPVRIRASVRRARLLITNDREREHAASLLSKAKQTFTELGMDHYVGLATGLEAQPALPERPHDAAIVTSDAVPGRVEG